MNTTLSLPVVSTVLPNGIDTQGRPVAGLDWSRKEVLVQEKNKPVARFATLADAAKQYVGYVWCLESTADSFELQNRKDDLEAIRAANIEAYCFNPKYTSRYRIVWDDIPKSDEADAEVILRIFTETSVTCGKFKEINRKDDVRAAIGSGLVRDRQYDGESSIALAKEILPEYKDMPCHLLEFIYKPTSIKAKNPKNPTHRKQIGRILLAARQIRDAGFGYRTFRRQVGNYGQGYGCMLRSEYYHWIVMPVTKARLKALGIKETTKLSHVDVKTKEQRTVRIWQPEELAVKKQVMRELDRVNRWLWKLTE